MAFDTKDLGYLPLAALMGALINAETVNKVKMIEVETTNDDWFESPNRIEDLEELVRMLIEFDDDNDPAIRVGFHTVTGSTKLPRSLSGCDELQLTRSLIGKTSDGKPYLRVVCSFLT